jgi:hypothetical protein
MTTTWVYFNDFTWGALQISRTKNAEPVGVHKKQNQHSVTSFAMGVASHRKFS